MIAIRDLEFLRDRAYVTVSANHFFIDILNNSRTLLVAIIAVSMGLSNAQVGIALLLYNVGSALSQPFFGLIGDRFGTNLLVFGGMGWMVGLYSIAAIGNDWVALAALTLAGFGSGAFHPSATKVASEASHQARTQATAMFFFAGQFGLFFGPILTGLLLESFGRTGYLLLPLLALTVLIGSWYWSSKDPIVPTKDPSQSLPAKETPKRDKSSSIPWRTIIPLTTIIIFTSTVSIAIMNFTPKLFTEQGYAPLYVGATAGFFMLGSAVGGVVGGTLGDRIGGEKAILIGLLGALAPVYFFIPASDLTRLSLLLIAGFFGGMPHSVLVIKVQSLLPGRRAFASGLTLGLMFFSGAVGSYFLGLTADQVGLSLALQGMAVLLLAAAVATILLPKQ